MSEEVIYVDASGKVAGRLASIIAKNLLSGKKIVVLNVEKAVITGGRKFILSKFTGRFRIQSKINPRRHGPFKYKSPNGIFRRIVRGMLPREKDKGRKAYKRLSVYVGTPSEFKNVKVTNFPEANHRRSPCMSLEEVSRTLGWKPIREKLMGEEVG